MDIDEPFVEGNHRIHTDPLAAEVVFYSHNLRALADGVPANIPSLATALGWDTARLVYGALIILPYILGLLVCVSAPLAVWDVVPFWRARPRQAQALIGLERPSIWLHLAFGLLLTLGLGLGYAG